MFGRLSEDHIPWPRTLLFPTVSVLAVLRAGVGPAPEEAVAQLFEWERDRLLGLAKGLGATAASALLALAGVALEGGKELEVVVAVLLVIFAGLLLGWAAVILVSLQRLPDNFAVARSLVLEEQS
ncbi:MAG: hypothetical protein WA880_13345 [Ornithinimicrobium sp.]